MQTILPKTLTVEIPRLGKAVELRELSVGYVDRCKQNPDVDTPINTILEATDLGAEEIERLGESEIVQLVDLIMGLTFPDAEESDERDDGGKP